MKTVVYTQRVEIIESYNERRDCADQRIADFIYECGYLPVPIPNKADIAADLISAIQPAGIILTGGNSLVKYGGNAPERDAMDKEVIRISIKEKIPLYGFCRGMQSILDYYGNTLVNVEGHVAVRHIIEGSGEQHEVNSYHNQACLELSGDELIVVYRTKDSVIEEIKHCSLPIAATMWHPERETEFTDFDINRVRKLFH